MKLTIFAATGGIVAAMQATGVRRIVVVSAAPVGTVPSPGRPNPPKHDPGDGFFMRHLGAPLAAAMFRAHYADLALMEDILRDSGGDSRDHLCREVDRRDGALALPAPAQHR